MLMIRNRSVNASSSSRMVVNLVLPTHCFLLRMALMLQPLYKDKSAFNDIMTLLSLVAQLSGLIYSAVRAKDNNLVATTYSLSTSTVYHRCMHLRLHSDKVNVARSAVRMRYQTMCICYRPLSLPNCGMNLPSNRFLLFNSP